MRLSNGPLAAEQRDILLANVTCERFLGPLHEWYGAEDEGGVTAITG